MKLSKRSEKGLKTKFSKKFFTLKDFDVKNKRVLVRVDFNVPLDDKGNVTDDTKLKASLPTIKYLIKNKAMIILMCHVKDPKGEIIENLKTAKIAKRLQKLLKKKVYYIDDCIGQDVEDFIDKMVDGEVLLLENLRFYKEEKENNAKFASALADLADLYVNDAFGTAHRPHASIIGVPKHLPSAAGFLLQKEIETMGQALSKPKRPFIAIMGGLKVSDKIKAINNLLKKVDYLLIGGAMAFTFFAAKGYKIGNSVVEKEKIFLAKKLLKNKKIILPIDTIVGDKFDPKAKIKIVKSTEIPDNWQGLDIGPETIKLFSSCLKKAKTVIWNGTLGVAEWPRFAKGSRTLAKTIAGLKATTIIGGGETTALVEQLKLENKMTHISTGGGASLEFLEGKKLPAIKALENSYKRFK